MWMQRQGYGRERGRGNGRDWEGGNFLARREQVTELLLRTKGPISTNKRSDGASARGTSTWGMQQVGGRAGACDSPAKSAPAARARAPGALEMSPRWLRCARVVMLAALNVPAEGCGPR